MSTKLTNLCSNEALGGNDGTPKGSAGGREATVLHGIPRLPMYTLPLKGNTVAMTKVPLVCKWWMVAVKRRCGASHRSKTLNNEACVNLVVSAIPSKEIAAWKPYELSLTCSDFAFSTHKTSAEFMSKTLCNFAVSVPIPLPTSSNVVVGGGDDDGGGGSSVAAVVGVAVRSRPNCCSEATYRRALL